MNPQNERHRPIYHYTPEPAECSSLASADGLIYWKGRYHVFYQHNKRGKLHNAPMEWGHAESPDMIHWKELPTALIPTPGGSDEAGCFSGCTVDNNGVPTILYTGVTRLNPPIDYESNGRKYTGFWANHRQCLATGSDDLLYWEKHPDNPILSKGHETGLEGPLVPHWHDPCVWREDDTWYMLIGSGVEGAGAAHLLYRSIDLINWLFYGTFYSISEDHHSSCPDFFRLPEHDILLEARGNRYFAGSRTNQQFIVTTQGITDFGIGSANAPKTFTDGIGRRIMMAGILESREIEAQRSAGWSGVLSLPRLTTISSDGVLGMKPLPELGSLRRDSLGTEFDVVASDTFTLFEFGGDSIEIISTVDMRGAHEFRLAVLCSPDQEEETLIVYSQSLRRLFVDRHRSSTDPDVNKREQGGEFRLVEEENLELHIFVDRSIIEVFANGRAALTTRIYPTRDDAKSIGVSSRGGSVGIQSIQVWEMESTSPQ